jgi:hypothetical protein
MTDASKYHAYGVNLNLVLSYIKSVHTLHLRNNRNSAGLYHIKRPVRYLHDIMNVSSERFCRILRQTWIGREKNVLCISPDGVHLKRVEKIATILDIHNFSSKIRIWFLGVNVSKKSVFTFHSWGVRVQYILKIHHFKWDLGDMIPKRISQASILNPRYVCSSKKGNNKFKEPSLLFLSGNVMAQKTK